MGIAILDLLIYLTYIDITWEHVIVVNWRSLYRNFERAVLLQVWVSILVLAPFKAQYRISLPSKHILITMDSNSILIRGQSIECH